MPPDDFTQLDKLLEKQLKGYDWEGVTESAEALAQLIEKLPTPLDERIARDILGRLRTSRRFSEMLRVSTAVAQSGQKSAQVRRQMAQAFVELGRMPEAEFVLEELLRDPQTSIGEQNEAWGLLGRISKQAYIDVEKQFGTGRSTDLDKAIEAYERAYQSNPYEHFWQGINTVALLNRRGDVGRATALAQSVLDTLDQREKASTESNPSEWETATRMEACVALGRHAEAVRAVDVYVRAARCKAFYLESTRRQMEDVWRLRDDTEPGRSILPLLRATLLRAQSGGLRLQASNVAKEGTGLEAQFGPEGSQTIVWYRKGLDRCKGIARIEKADKGVGTGWLVRAQDFFPKRPADELMLLTNAHVVATPKARSEAAGVPPLLAGEARVDFRAIGSSPVVVGVKEVYWSSPVHDLDASFLVLDTIPAGAEALPLDTTKVAMPTDPKTQVPRMYIIGHPDGRDLEISLYDNRLVGCDHKFLHYRTPTERGNSGSPVLEQNGWCAVALHHRGLNEMPVLDKPGETYQANEGVLVSAIQERTRAQ